MITLLNVKIKMRQIEHFLYMLLEKKTTTLCLVLNN